MVSESRSRLGFGVGGAALDSGSGLCNGRQRLPVLLVTRQDNVRAGQIIDSCLSNRGWSRARLGKEAGIDPGHLSRLMSGDREWTVEAALKVARVLNMDSRVIWP